jgi:ATP:ADP antiporter, AAA family
MQTSLRKIQAFLGVEPGEGSRVWGLTALYAILIMGVVFVQTIAFALFLGEFGPQQLPYSYVSTAILASLSAYGFLKLAERMTFQNVLLLNIGFALVGCIIFWLALNSPVAPWAIFLLPTWFQIHINVVNLVVWPLAGRLFDVRQAKRVLGIVGAGNWIANIIGGFVVAPLIGLLGTNQMFLFAGAMTALGLWLLWWLVRSHLEPAAPPRPAAPTSVRQNSATKGSKPVLRLDQATQRYIWLIMAYVVLWWIAFFYLDNIFYDRAAAQYTDAAELAQAIGLLLSAIGGVALVTSLFGTGFVLRRFGLQATFLAMPVVCGIFMLVLALSGSFGQGGALLFWLAAMGKLINVAWGFSFSQTALVLSYQPIPSTQRGQTQTLIEGIIQPLAIGFAGLSLLGLNTLLGFGAVALAWVFGGLTLLLILVIVLIGRQYPRALSQVLARRQWGGTGTAPLDQAGLALLRGSLRDPYPAAVIYSMNTLEQADPALLAEALPELLRHPTAEVRQAALERIEQLRLQAALPLVERLLASESVAAVTAVALRGLAALTEPAQAQQLYARLNDPDRQIRRGALVGLLRYGSGEGRSLAEAKLDELVASPLPMERVLAARVLADLGRAGFATHITALLNDQKIEVVREALKAAAVMGDPQVWPAVVGTSAVQGARHLTVRALVAGGEAVLPAIGAAFTGTLPDHQVQVLSNACGRIGGEKAVQLLLSKLHHPSDEVRTAILEGLSTAHYRATTPEAIHGQIRAEVAHGAWIAATLVDLGENESTRMVATALGVALRKAGDRVCLLLSFVYDREALLRARAALARGAGPHYAYALEILDTQLPGELKNIVMPIVEDLTPQERLARLTPLFPQHHEPVAARLSALIAGTTTGMVAVWTRACALYGAGSLPAPECLPAAQAALHDPNQLVQAAAHWTVARLDLNTAEGDRTMLSIVEKVIILKTVDVFGRMPDDVLVDVAALLEEADVAEGEQIFQKGDAGDSLYIIVAGKMRVDDGDRFLNYLDARAVFGEMALLDSEPRVASVTAIEPTRLLRLAQEPFFELISDRPEVAVGLIHVLTGHLRARVRDVTQLSAEVKELRAAGGTAAEARTTIAGGEIYAAQPS